MDSRGRPARCDAPEAGVDTSDAMSPTPEATVEELIHRPPHDVNEDIEFPELAETRSWLRWKPTSMAALRDAERRILSHVKSTWRGRFVDIGPCVSEEACKVWTLAFNEKSKRIPLVLVHGFAAGVALWSLNFDALAAHRPLYAMDLLGFGRSSRPAFSSNSLEAENQLVKSIEEWRQEMYLEKFVLLGHSMGGFLATSYALKYPNRVEHLILADPWGFPERPPENELQNRMPLWVRTIATMLKPFNALVGIRVAGPWGPGLVKKARPDLARKFLPLTGDDIDAIPEYIYHCNVQNPSGEAAFHAMSAHFGWAKNPMINRINTLDQQVPLTIIYGAKSWVDKSSGERILEERADLGNVEVKIIPEAGHHVYADTAKTFNDMVNEICQKADEAAAKSVVEEALPEPVL